MRRVKAVLLSRQLGLAVLVAAVAVYFGAVDATTAELFRDPWSFFDRTRHWVEIGMLAVPMTFIIATAGIDLSVGSLLALSGIVGGMMFRDAGAPLWVALLTMALAGLAGGAFNGVLVAGARVPPLVVTLGTLALFRGLAMGLSKADPINVFPEGFVDWGMFGAFPLGDYELPHQAVLMLAVFAVGMVVFTKFRIGRWSTQVGENERAARFAAVPVRWVHFALYAASGLVCGLGAITYSARYATAMPDAAQGLELEVIAAVVVGGTRITGGGGSVLGSLLGLLLIGMLRFGLELRDVPQQHQIILIGVLVVVVAVLNEWMARRAEGRRA